MKRNIILIIIWFFSYSVIYTQNNEFGGGVFFGSYANENFGFNLNFSHSLDDSKHLQTELNVASVNYHTSHFKHSSGIYSIEENFIISHSRINTSNFAYIGFGIGYYLITSLDYIGNWHENTYTKLSLSNALGVNFKLGVRLSFLEFGIKNILLLPHAKGVLNEHFLPDKSINIDKFIAINLFRFYLGLKFNI